MPDTPTDRIPDRCPDGGTCWHACPTDPACWRVGNAAPLTSYGDTWPADVRAAYDAAAPSCSTCGGRGRVPATPGQPADGYDPCPDCSCETCGGHGVVPYVGDGTGDDHQACPDCTPTTSPGYALPASAFAILQANLGDMEHRRDMLRRGEPGQPPDADQCADGTWEWRRPVPGRPHLETRHTLNADTGHYGVTIGHPAGTDHTFVDRQCACGRLDLGTRPPSDGDIDGPVPGAAITVEPGDLVEIDTPAWADQLAAEQADHDPVYDEAGTRLDVPGGPADPATNTPDHRIHPRTQPPSGNPRPHLHANRIRSGLGEEAEAATLEWTGGRTPTEAHEADEWNDYASAWQTHAHDVATALGADPLDPTLVAARTAATRDGGRLLTVTEAARALGIDTDSPTDEDIAAAGRALDRVEAPWSTPRGPGLAIAWQDEPVELFDLGPDRFPLPDPNPPFLRSVADTARAAGWQDTTRREAIHEALADGVDLPVGWQYQAITYDRVDVPAIEARAQARLAGHALHAWYTHAATEAGRPRPAGLYPDGIDAEPRQPWPADPPEPAGPLALEVPAQLTESMYRWRPVTVTDHSDVVLDTVRRLVEGGNVAPPSHFVGVGRHSDTGVSGSANNIARDEHGTITADVTVKRPDGEETTHRLTMSPQVAALAAADPDDWWTDTAVAMTLDGGRITLIPTGVGRSPHEPPPAVDLNVHVRPLRFDPGLAFRGGFRPLTFDDVVTDADATLADGLTQVGDHVYPTADDITAMIDAAIPPLVVAPGPVYGADLDAARARHARLVDDVAAVLGIPADDLQHLAEGELAEIRDAMRHDPDHRDTWVRAVRTINDAYSDPAVRELLTGEPLPRGESETIHAPLGRLGRLVDSLDTRPGPLQQLADWWRSRRAR